jgi:hypothetical protein
MSDSTHCHLCRVDGVPKAEFDTAVEAIESVSHSSHLTKALLRCRACRQLYFRIWYELIDWNGGDDQGYEICVPVSGHEEIERLEQMLPPPMSLDLLTIAPRLQIETTGDARRVYWVPKG